MVMVALIGVGKGAKDAGSWGSVSWLPVKVMTALSAAGMSTVLFK